MTPSLPQKTTNSCETSSVFTPAFEQLIGDDLANFSSFGITVRGKVELNFQPVWIAGFCEKLFRFLGVVGIAFNLGIIADNVRADGPVHHITIAFVDVLDDRRRIDGVIDRLSHKLVVKGLMG